MVSGFTSAKSVLLSSMVSFLQGFASQVGTSSGRPQGLEQLCMQMEIGET